jgi:hypothetical protein
MLIQVIQDSWSEVVPAFAVPTMKRLGHPAWFSTPGGQLGGGQEPLSMS